MTEISGKTVKRVSQCSMAVKAREECQIRLLFTQHIGLIGNWSLNEPNRQARTTALAPTPAAAGTPPAGPLQCDYWHSRPQLTSTIRSLRVLERWSPSTTRDPMALTVSTCPASMLDRTSREKAPGDRARDAEPKSTFRLALHSAVVSQGCWIKANAVKTDFSATSTNSPPNRLGIKAAIKKELRIRP